MIKEEWFRGLDAEVSRVYTDKGREFEMGGETISEPRKIYHYPECKEDPFGDYIRRVLRC